MRQTLSEIVEIRQKSKASSGDNHRPEIIPWHKVKMIRTQAFTAATDEIMHASKVRDVVTVSLIGAQHTGKSALARAIAHQVHTKSEIPYNVVIFNKDQLMNLKVEMEKLEPSNYIFIYDDLSFLKANYTTKRIDQVKEQFTTIRHFKDRQDIKVLNIYNFHYSPGFDKYLRQTDFKFWTSIGESEIDYVLKTRGNKYADTINSFQKACGTCLSKSYWVWKLSNKKPFLYKYMDPFIPTLFASGTQNLRPVVTPTRAWLQQGKICTTCEVAEGNTNISVDFDEMIRKAEINYGKMAFIAAVKARAFTEGKNVYGKRVSDAVKWLMKAQSEYNVPTDRFLIHYGLETKTTWSKKPKFVPENFNNSTESEDHVTGQNTDN